MPAILAASLALIMLLVVPCGASAKQNTTMTSLENPERPAAGAQEAIRSPATYPIPQPDNPKCPWLSGDAPLGPARRNPLLKAMVQRTRMAAPFGPGSWPNPIRIDEEEGEPQQFGWTGVVMLSATVRIDKEAAAKWLPKSLMNITVDTATVFVLW